MAERHDPKTLVSNLVTDTSALVKDNIALAKAEVQPMVKHAGVGGGLFGAAGYLAANAASLLFLAGGFGFALLLAHLAKWGALASLALGFVIMAVLLLVLAGLLGLLGKGQISKVHAPTETINEAKATVDSVKRSLSLGVAEVDADVRDRKGLAQAKRAAKDLDETSSLPTAASTSTVSSASTTTVPAAATTGSGAHAAH